MINVSEALGLEKYGIVFSDDDDTTLFYLTFGTGSPMGTQAPVPTLYIQNDGTLWRKVGTGVNDWTQGDAEDHHAGYNEILAGQIVTIQARKEMRVYRHIINYGTIVNRGKLVII